MAYTIPPTLARARSKVAGLSRDRAADDPEFLEARRDLAAEKTKEQVRRNSADVPSFTDAQISDIVRILRGGDAA